MVENYLVKHQKGRTCENLQVHTGFREGIGSTHRGILETFTSSFKSKYHQLESRAWLAKLKNRIHQWHYVSRKELLNVFLYEGHCRMIKSTKDLTVLNEGDASIGTQPEQETMQRYWIIGTTD